MMEPQAARLSDRQPQAREMTDARDPLPGAEHRKPKAASFDCTTMGPRNIAEKGRYTQNWPLYRSSIAQHVNA